VPKRLVLTEFASKTSQKVHLLTFKCYRFRKGHFWRNNSRQKFLTGSLEPVLAGFGIKVAVEKSLGFPAAAALSKMTFAVGHI
jgi:hypothetical protein